MASYWEDPYRPDNLCVLCRKPTEERREFFSSAGLRHFSHMIPVHSQCYRWQKLPIIVKVIAVWCMLEACLLLLANLFFWPHQSFLKIPLWSFVVTGLLAVIFPAYIGIKASLDMEFKIKDYIDAHTDHEDHYKSDREPWRRDKI